MYFRDLAPGPSGHSGQIEVAEGFSGNDLACAGWSPSSRRAGRHPASDPRVGGGHLVWGFPILHL
jgi:hypothetical protein